MDNTPQLFIVYTVIVPVISMLMSILTSHCDLSLTTTARNNSEQHLTQPHMLADALLLDRCNLTTPDAQQTSQGRLADR